MADGVRWDDQATTGTAPPTLTRPPATTTQSPTAGITWDDQKPQPAPALKAPSTADHSTLGDLGRRALGAAATGAGELVQAYGDIGKKVEQALPFTATLHRAQGITPQGVQDVAKGIESYGANESANVSPEYAKKTSVGLTEPGGLSLTNLADKAVTTVAGMAPALAGTVAASALGGPAAGVAAGSTLFGLQGEAAGRNAGEQQVAALTDQQLQQIPAYQNYLKAGLTPEQARAKFGEDVANRQALVSGGFGAGLGLVGEIPGVNAAGKAIASKLTRPIGARAAQAIGKGAAEGAGFAGINAAGQVVNNVTNPIPTPATQGVGEAAASGLLPGFVLGGARGVLTRPQAQAPEPNPGAAPGSLSDAANVLQRAAPDAQALAGSETPTSTTEAQSPITRKMPPPPVPWINTETGEQRTPTASEVVAAFHRMQDDQAQADANNVKLVTGLSQLSDAWGVPLERLKSLRRVAISDRAKGVTTADAEQRAAEDVAQQQATDARQQVDRDLFAGHGQPADEAAPPPAPTDAGVPFMITRTMRADLAARGFSDDAIAHMTPQDAHAALAAPEATQPMQASAAETRVAPADQTPTNPKPPEDMAAAPPAGEQSQPESQTAAESEPRALAPDKLDAIVQRWRENQGEPDAKDVATIAQMYRVPIGDVKAARDRTNPNNPKGSTSHAFAQESQSDTSSSAPRGTGGGSGDEAPVLPEGEGRHAARTAAAETGSEVGGREAAANQPGEPQPVATPPTAQPTKAPRPEVESPQAGEGALARSRSERSPDQSAPENASPTDQAAGEPPAPSARATAPAGPEEVAVAGPSSNPPEGGIEAKNKASAANNQQTAVNVAERATSVKRGKLLRATGEASDRHTAKRVALDAGDFHVGDAVSFDGGKGVGRLAGTISAKQPHLDMGIVRMDRPGRDGGVADSYIAATMLKHERADVPEAGAPHAALPANDVETAAKESAAHPENERPGPTPAQHEAGNFKSGHVNLHGLDVTIQVPKGGLRRGTDRTGKAWERAASDHYGHIRRTEGADGEPVDVYSGPHAEDPKSNVFVIDQVKPGTKTFDEHKAMVGFKTGRDARASYDRNFPKGLKTFGGIRKMSMDEFKDWVKHGDTTKPVSVAARATPPVSAKTTLLAKPSGFPVGGWHAVDAQGNVLRKADAPDGTMPPRFKTAEQADAFARKQMAKRPEKGTNPSQIEDIGEKIGGARKDTAVKTGRAPRADKEAETSAERPGWMNRYEVSQITSSSRAGETGRWTVHDKRQKLRRNNFISRTDQTFATKEEAEAAIPLMALVRNHGVGRREEGNYGIYRRVTDRKLVWLKDGFATPEDAKRYMAQHAKDLIETKTSVGEEALPKPETVTRQGPARRHGDVKPEQFRDTFGFRGVEFGNWNSQGERQEVMNHAFDGLHDLAELLNIPPKAISLNGELGLAFGARGQGLSGARAHYERDRVVMNLTKMKGAGALAHEWFHALDHYLGRQSGRTGKEWRTLADGTRVLKTAGDVSRDMASYGADRPSALRDELRQAYATLINTMQRRATRFVRDTAKLEQFTGKARERLEGRLARVRDNLAQEQKYGTKGKMAPASAEQLAEFDAIAQRMVNGENLELRTEATKPAAGRKFSSGYRRTNDDLNRLSAIMKAVRGRAGFSADGHGIMNEIAGLMHAYDVRLTEAADARANPEAETTKPTSFRMEAIKADQGRGTNYWSTHHEMAARAFSAYIEDKLAAEHRNSDFLSYGSDERFRLLIPEFPRPFPGGEERVAIDKAFDTFFATVKHAETENGNVALFSRRGWDGFPDAVVAHKPGAVRENRDYAAAKAGDDAAALRLAKDVVTSGFADAVRRAIPEGSKPTIVPVLAVEEAGKNRIPLAAANVLGERLGLPVADNIVQSRKVSRGGSDAMHRVAVQPTFEGKVKPGDYILLDDTLTQGGTLAQLKTHIEDNGGRVVLATALTGKDFSRKLALEPKTLDEVRERFGPIENWWRDTFGHGFEGLTQSEARAILAYKPRLRPDALRNLVAKARNESLVGVDAGATGRGSQSRPLNPIADALHGLLARSKVQEIVDRTTAKWGDNQPRVRVVEDGEGLPASAKADPGYKTAEGYYDPKTGTAYLVASNLTSPRRAMEVLAHEAIGHHGVENVVDHAFGVGAWQKIEDAIGRLDKGGKASDAMRSVLQETHRRYAGADPATFAKEFLAVSAEKGVRNTFLDRVVTAIRKFLRQIMPHLQLNERELRQALVQAERYVRESTPYRERVAQKAAMAFSSRPDTFYSALTEAVATGKGAPKKADSTTWKQWLDGAQRRGEFKAAEREWMGVDQWLDEHKGPVTRAELNGFVRDNQVRVQEVMRRDEIPVDEAAGIHENDDGTFELVDHEGAVGESTKFGEYTLPGGKNYRELLLTLPERDALTGDERTELGRLTERKQTVELGRPGVKPLSAEETARMRALQDKAIAGNKAPFHSNHFDEPNIIAHVRMNDRTGPDGEKILHVEEVQSDWHQAGRKGGYFDPDKPWEVFRLRDGEPAGQFATESDAKAEAQRLGREFDYARGNEGGDRARVPNAPFKKEWPMLAMKRVLRYAADHGYDRVTWATGEQQAARYDLSKQVHSVTWKALGPDSKQVAIDVRGGDFIKVAVGPDGRVRGLRGQEPAPQFDGQRIGDVLGKDLGDRIMANAEGKVSGDGLKVGGQGMHAFYDKMLPNELNKYVKQWGAKVAETRIGTAREHEMATALRERGYDPATVTDQQILSDNGGRRPMWLTDDDLEAIRDGSVAEVEPMRADVHSIDITPAMRESVQRGQPLFSKRDEDKATDPSREPHKTVKDIEAVLRDGDPSGMRDKAKAWLRGKFEDFRPAMLGALQTRHVLELMEDSPPLKGSGRNYERSMQQMDADRQQLMAGAPDAAEHPNDMLKKGAVTIAQEMRQFAYGKGLGALRGRVRPEAQKLFDMMHAATMQRMDPDKAYERLTIENAHGDAVPWTHEEVKARLKLLRELALQRGGDAWADREKIRDEIKYLRNLPKMERNRERNWPKLQADWQALPEEAKGLYRQVRDWYSQYRDETEKALIKNIEALDMPETYRRSLVNRMRLRFEEARREGVYFPLNRDGAFWIAFRDIEGNEGFKMFESARDFERGEKRLRAAGFQIDAKGRRDQNMKAQDAPSGTFVRQVIDVLQQAKVSEGVQDEVYQTFLRSLPELSMRKHAIHRKNIAGYSEDALRAFAKNGYHGAHQLARLRHAQDMGFALEAMKASVDNWRRGENSTDTMKEPNALEVAKADALVGEMAKRHEWIMHPTDQRLANMVNSVGFIYYLGASPSSALTNLTQVAQTVLPVLGAEHGWGKATRMLGAAWRDAARTVGHMDRTLKDPDERRAFMVMQQRGDFSKTQSHTLAGLAEGNVLQTSPVWSRTMNAISWMFHTAEVINREATGMAAYRLARAKGMDFNKAVEYAGETNANANFDYAAANRPRYMQGNVQRIALQFKNYSVGMSWLFYRNLFQAMKGETPEIRRVARRTVTGILGMTAILAGSTGLPVYNAVRMTANAANALWGDDNEPWNFDDAFHRWLGDNLGPDAARLIAEGPTNYLTGANVASRTSMANLWIHDDDQRLEGADAYHALLENLAGPIGGIVNNWYVGAEDVRRGHLERGVERMLPTAVKNSIKSLRYAHEGVNSLRGDPIVPDVSGWQEFLQAIGFQPAAVADQYRINTAMKNYTGEIGDRRINLMNAYALALKAGDDGDTGTVLRKISAFNQAHPEVAITAARLRASLRQRARLSAQATNGVVLNRRLALQAQQYAGVAAQ